MARFKASRSHRHTKFNVYTGDAARRKKNKEPSMWWLILISAVAAVIFALALGNCLGSQVEDGGEESTPAEIPESTEPQLPETADVGEIDAVFVGLEGITDNTHAEVSKQIPEGTHAISLSMFTSSGAPLYESEVASAAGKNSGELTLKNIFRYANENGIYVSVPFPSDVLTSRDSVLWDVDEAYEIALIKELYEAGADEVIVRCTAFGESGAYSLGNEDFVNRVCEYLSDLRHKLPEIHIGFMISANDASSASLAVIVDKINGYADFLAVDMTAITAPEELKTATNDALVSILRYEMRVLVDGSEEALPDIYGVLDSLGVKNRQAAIKNN
jgi:hypothetical protein